jgi:hypothetical protein
MISHSRLKNLGSAQDFIEGWLVHYNYLRPHTALDDKTPAEVAGIDFPYENWADIIRKHKPSKPVIIEHQPRDSMKIDHPQTIGRKHKRIRVSKKQGRITPPMPKLSEIMGKLR